MSHGENSNPKPSAIPPKDQLTRPPSQDDQGHPAQSDNRPAEFGKEKGGNKLLLSGSNVVAAFSLLVAALSLIFSLNQSTSAEVSRQRDQIIEYTEKVATLTADNSEQNHTFEIAALSSQAVALLPNVPDVPATVYARLARAMIDGADNFDTAEMLLNESIIRAAAANDIQQQIYAHQIMAEIRYRDRDLDGLRKEYMAAVSLSETYHGKHQNTMKYGYGGYTLAQWAEHEANLGHCEEARAHLKRAREWAKLAFYPGMEKDLSDRQKTIDACRTV
jgi:hypothetical protein